jgi:hypothetical protein
MGASGPASPPGMMNWPPKFVEYRVYKTFFFRWWIDKYVDGLNTGPVISSLNKDIVTAKAVELQMLGANVVFENK